MCDYSLQGIKNRLAEEGEVLAVHRFTTGSKGLASQEPTLRKHKAGSAKAWLEALKSSLAPQNQECAVCIPDGAKLLLSEIPASFQRRYGVSPKETVTFRQLSQNAIQYRDAVEFANGAKVRLQELDEGLSFRVLSLGGAEAEAGDLKTEVKANF